MATSLERIEYYVASYDADPDLRIDVEDLESVARELRATRDQYAALLAKLNALIVITIPAGSTYHFHATHDTQVVIAKVHFR